MAFFNMTFISISVRKCTIASVLLLSLVLVDDLLRALNELMHSVTYLYLTWILKWITFDEAHVPRVYILYILKNNSSIYTKSLKKDRIM